MINPDDYINFPPFIKQFYTTENFLDSISNSIIPSFGLGRYLMEKYNMTLIKKVTPAIITEEVEDMANNYTINEDSTVTIKNWLYPNTYPGVTINIQNHEIANVKKCLDDCYASYKLNYLHQKTNKHFVSHVSVFSIKKNVKGDKVYDLSIPKALVIKLKGEVELRLQELQNTLTSSKQTLTKEFVFNSGSSVYALNTIFIAVIKYQEHITVNEYINKLLNSECNAIDLTENDNIRAHLYNFIGFNSPKINNKYEIYQYSILDKQNNTPSPTPNQVGFYSQYNYRESNYEYTIRLSIKDDVITKDVKELSIDNFYIKYSEDIRKLSSYKLDKIAIDIGYRANAFDIFNRIKNTFMLYGYNEHEAVTSILKASNNSSGLFTCAITNQLLPDMFKGTVKFSNGEQITASTVFLSYYANNVDVPKYKRIDSYGTVYEECIIKDATDWNKININRNNKHNPLHFNSIRSLPEENVKVFKKDNLYRPIPFLGFELEVEPKVNAKANITESVLNKLGMEYVILKKDGSVPTGFEITSIPATLKYHKVKSSAFMDDMALKGQLTSFYSASSCGMHVHISRNSFTALHLAKFLQFINSSVNNTFITGLAQRTSEQYARFTPFKDIKKEGKTTSSLSLYANRIGNKLAAMPNGHYDAVNTANPMTIEVRIFKGNLSKLHFLKNLQFVHALWAYTKDASFKDIDYKNFIHWLVKEQNKDYAELLQWVIGSKYNVTNINVTKDSKGSILDKAKEAKKLQVLVNKKFNILNDDKFKKTGKDKFTDIKTTLASA